MSKKRLPGGWPILLAAALAGYYVNMRRRPARRPRLVGEPDLATKGPRPRAVVLGAGFGGLSAALELARAENGPEVVLVDRNNYHLFVPLLFQVAVSLVQPEDVTYPVRAIAARHGFHFLEAEVDGIDLVENRVRTSAGEVAYDYLIVALGSVTNFYGLSEVEGRSLPLKTMPEAVRLRNEIVGALERAEWERDEARRQALLTFAIAGGGPTGLELAGALAALLGDVAGREYPALHPDQARILVLEAGDAVLPGMHPDLARMAMARLGERGVDIRLRTRIVGREHDRVLTADGQQIPATTFIWAAGVQGPPIVCTLPGEKTHDRRVIVNRTLQLPAATNVYAVGDCAAVFERGSERPVPALAPAAIQMGQVAARNILRQLAGAPLPEFHYRRLGNLVILGRHAGGAEVLGARFDGFPAWLAWRLVHLAWLTGFRNKLEVLLDWAFLYVAPRQTARIHE